MLRYIVASFQTKCKKVNYKKINKVKKKRIDNGNKIIKEREKIERLSKVGLERPWLGLARSWSEKRF